MNSALGLKEVEPGVEREEKKEEKGEKRESRHNRNKKRRRTSCVSHIYLRSYRPTITTSAAVEEGKTPR